MNLNFIKDYIDIHSPGYQIEIFNNGRKEEYLIGNRSILPSIKKVRKNTLYDIASLTKLFTAVCIYISYENKLLDINDYIYNIDNNFKYLKNITILDLLSHNKDIYTKGYLGDAKNKEEFYNIVYSAYLKSNNPTYADINYIILSFILESIYKKSFDKIVKELIIEKLKLKHTTFNPRGHNIASNNYEHNGEHLETSILPGVIYDKKARIAKKYGIYTGHASIFTTGSDLLIFLKSLLDNSLLKKETIKLMLKHYDTNKNNYDLLHKMFKEKDINDMYLKAIEKSIYLPKTYNYMGCRYKNIIDEENDVPTKLSDNSIVLYGYCGSMFAIDFDKKIIVIVMCNVMHNTRLNRLERKKMTTIIIDEIVNGII